MATDFFDGWLDDPEALARADGLLRPLAEAGARVRRQSDIAEESLAELVGETRPRAVIAVGPEARLLRAVLEPTCPVPFVAWPNLGLPGWVGPLDIVVVLGEQGRLSAACVHESLRRGSRLLVVAPRDSAVARQSGSRATTLLPVENGDSLTSAIVALRALEVMELGTSASLPVLADAMDAVARDCSHRLETLENPAKQAALALADGVPLVWGGSVLAARASRRIAEALRSATGRVALAADATALAPLLASAVPRDPFADPFLDLRDEEGRPALVVIEDGLGDPASIEQRDLLESNAQQTDVRVVELQHLDGFPIERYVTVLQKGLFAAAYLQIGLGRVRG